MRTTFGAFYIDLVDQEVSTQVLRLINRDPEPDSPLEDMQWGATPDTAIRLTIVATGANSITAVGTQVYVSVNGGPLALVFSTTSGPVFSTEYAASSTFISQKSPGALLDDEHVVKLVRATPFSSLDVIEVRVLAAGSGSSVLDETYSFEIEDLTVPAVSSISVRGFRRIRVLFTEPILPSGVGSAINLRNVSGGVEFIEPNHIRAPGATFTVDDVGLFVGVARANEAVNNGYFEISSVVSADTVAIVGEVAGEPSSLLTIAVVSPYRLAHVPPGAPVVEPAFTPIVLKALAVAVDELAPSEDYRRYVDLDLQDDLSPERTYTLAVAEVVDLFENGAEGLTFTFDAPPIPRASPPRYGLYDLIPALNKREDAAHEMEALVRCFDEAFQLIRFDVDRLSIMLDIDLAPAELLDALLRHLGNPFSFDLTETEKRRLADVLVEIYKSKGTEAGMEATLLFFLGIPLDVQPFNDPAGSWMLGVSELGIDTVLGPGTSFLKYAFQVVSTTALTELQRFWIQEIVEYMKVAHEHYVALKEPTLGVPPTPSTLWELGVSSLGESTVLDG
jgi:phage tail-like protein